jgi:hypothetical protein
METPKQRFITLDVKTVTYLGDLMTLFERSVINLTNKTKQQASKTQKPVVQSPVGR